MDTLLGWIIGLVAPLGAVVVILVFAVLIAALSLVVFRYTSNQEGIRRGKAKMKAGVLGVLLFRHDLRLMLREMVGSLLHSLANMRFLIVPMLVLIVPLYAVFVFLDHRLGYRPLRVGESAVLRVHLDDGQAETLDQVQLHGVEGVRITSPGVRIPELREVDFRIEVDAPGEHVVEVRVGQASQQKRVCATPPLSLLPPAEEAVSGASPIDRIDLAYEPISWEFLGIEWAWWVLLIVFMIPALFALRRPLGVDF